MVYENIIKGHFLNRPNRFIANVLINKREETVHVKNTGSCKELLVYNAEVILTKSANEQRKTKYDLIAVKKGNRWVNIDSQVTNKVVYEWLIKQDYSLIKPEYVYGKSRIDFYMEKENRKYLLEVKGCTLEKQGIGYFPDSPTDRGVKHILELINAKQEGFQSILAFVIQMEGIYEVRTNVETHPEFDEVCEKARKRGVEILFFECRVTENTIEVTKVHN